jgi:hypothetical protein
MSIANVDTNIDMSASDYVSSVWVEYDGNIVRLTGIYSKVS